MTFTQPPLSTPPLQPHSQTPDRCVTFSAPYAFSSHKMSHVVSFRLVCVAEGSERWLTALSDNCGLSATQYVADTGLLLVSVGMCLSVYLSAGVNRFPRCVPALCSGS